jgi:hypothetical protein
MVERVSAIVRRRAFSSSSEKTRSPCSSKLYLSRRSGCRSVALAFRGYTASARVSPPSFDDCGYIATTGVSRRQMFDEIGMSIIPVRLVIYRSTMQRAARSLFFRRVAVLTHPAADDSLILVIIEAPADTGHRVMLLFFLTPWVAFSLCMASPLPDALRVARAYPF